MFFENLNLISKKKKYHVSNRILIEFVFRLYADSSELNVKKIKFVFVFVRYAKKAELRNGRSARRIQIFTRRYRFGLLLGHNFIW